MSYPYALVGDVIAATSLEDGSKEIVDSGSAKPHIPNFDDVSFGT